MVIKLIFKNIHLIDLVFLIIIHSNCCNCQINRFTCPQAPDEIIADSDQMAAENLMFLAQDVVNYVESAELDPNVECVTEEVITDDWVMSGGQDRYAYSSYNENTIFFFKYVIYKFLAELK